MDGWTRAARLVGALVVIAACSEVAETGSPASASPGGGDPGITPVPGARDSGDAAATDASDGEASSPLALTIFPRHGDASDDTTAPAGPGLVLDGGTLVAAGITWARMQLGADTSSRAFDAVVLTADGGDGTFLYDMAPFRSMQTIRIPPNAGPADFAAAAVIVSHAELVFFPGGEQTGYIPWKGTALAQAVQDLYGRGGVVVGTSAGALVLGAFAFDAIAAGISENVTPALALADPFDPKISFTRHMFTFPPLADAITEVHFEQRDRMGRLAMFMARQHADAAIARVPPFVLGVAIDEHAAIVVDKTSTGKLLRDDPAGRAFLVKGGPPQTCTAGQRLVYPGLEVHRLDDPAQVFDFVKWCGTAPVYTLDVSASASDPFGGSPYDRPGTSSPCP